MPKLSSPSVRTSRCRGALSTSGFCPRPCNDCVWEACKVVALNDDGSYDVEIEGDGTLCGEVTAEYLRPAPAAVCKEAEQTTRATSEGKGGGRCGETEPEAGAEQTEGAGEADGAAEEQAPEPLARSRPPRARKAVETFVAGPSQRPKPQEQADLYMYTPTAAAKPADGADGDEGGAASSADDDDDDDELTQTHEEATVAEPTQEVLRLGFGAVLTGGNDHGEPTSRSY